LSEKNKIRNFEGLFLLYFDAAYNLARWLMQNEADAEDAVQEAYLRAFRFFNGFRGENSRAWILKIVRNICYSHLQKNQTNNITDEFDEELLIVNTANPESILIRKIDQQFLKTSLGKLPVDFREVLVLRELEGFSYKEIADILGLPPGTVMSRLARARQRLQIVVNTEREGESK
jgi:RNA polymerase sigma-70 factor (ECF subfamily)